MLWFKVWLGEEGLLAERGPKSVVNFNFQMSHDGFFEWFADNGINRPDKLNINAIRTVCREP